tara:strand:+ start:145 stop:585 length:441 start_codon:yes stop_codon:yes gene_type:complete
MPNFSQNSLRKLNSCHPDLIKIFEEVVWMRDCTVIEGFRGKETQNELYRTDKSQVKFPNGNHNQQPSMAVDVMEYFPNKPHLHWSDKDGIEKFANYVIGVANSLLASGEIEHKIRWGADWDGDGVRVDKDPDETFFDGPHFELYKD